MQNIEKMNEKYRIVGCKGQKEIKFEPGDLVWLHLRKDRFIELRKSKLMSHAAGPFKILEKKLMIMPIGLCCLQILGLVPHLTFQFCVCTWARRMRQYMTIASKIQIDICIATGENASS
jgi:hypothetical protein